MDGFSLLREMVETPSPTGEERAVVELLLERARDDGFEARRDVAGNFVAEAGRGSRLLLFVGHVDTVPGRIPVRIEDDVLHGRGAVDAKGPLAAFYSAAHRFLDDPHLRIRIVGAVDEEGDSRGARALSRTEPPAWIVVGEPSGSDGLTLGYKGILRGELRVDRPHHHGAHAAPSAADELVQAWARLSKEFEFAERFDRIQGRLLGLDSRTDGLTDVASARFSFRLPPGTTSRETVQRLQALAHAADLGLEIGETMEPALADKRTPLVAAYLNAIRSEQRVPHLKRKTGTADFNLLHEWYPTVPIVAYGPGDARLDHTPDERVARSEFELGVRVNSAAIARLAATTPLTTPRKA